MSLACTCTCTMYMYNVHVHIYMTTNYYDWKEQLGPTTNQTNPLQSSKFPGVGFGWGSSISALCSPIWVPTWDHIENISIEWIGESQNVKC